VIVSNEGKPIWRDESVFAGTSTGIAFNGNNNTTVTPAVTYLTTTGSMLRSDSKNFIPPQSYVSRTTSPLITKLLKLPPRQQGSATKVTTTGAAVNAVRYTFDKDKTPLEFRAFLTLSYNDNYDHPIYVDREFWVTEVIAAGIRTKDHVLRNDEFSLTTTSGAGKVFAGVAIVGIVLVGATAGANAAQ
jgi:hypothetical protein